ncbi:UMP-CMP kinase [Mortierella claussenii]|nr:UMP-CMP kinase [Mortierella claussenii]
MSISLPPSFNYSLPTARVFVIGLAGGADSGKVNHSLLTLDYNDHQEAFCRFLIEQLQKSQVVDSSKALLLHLHDFYRELSDEDRIRVASGLYNFDHPDAFDWDLLAQVMDDIKEGNVTQFPKFDFATKSRSYETRSKDLESPSVVLLEGIFVLYSQRIRDHLNMKLFVDVDDDARLVNRVARKVAEANPDPIDHILTEYVRFVKPAFDDFIQPSKKWADIIIPRGLENTPAIELITSHAADLLGRQQQSKSTRPSRMNSSSTVLQEMMSNSASNVSSACPSPRPHSKSALNSTSLYSTAEPGSRSSMNSSPVPRKDVLSGSTDSLYKPVPE